MSANNLLKDVKKKFVRKIHVVTKFNIVLASDICYNFIGKDLK